MRNRTIEVIFKQYELSSNMENGKTLMKINVLYARDTNMNHTEIKSTSSKVIEGQRNACGFSPI